MLRSDVGCCEALIDLLESVFLASAANILGMAKANLSSILGQRSKIKLSS